MDEYPGQRLRHCGLNEPVRAVMQPLQGWDSLRRSSQGSARRATLGSVMQSLQDWLLSSL
jgi:hypothetical protein